MKTTADFLDALRAKLDLPSDGQLADHLGMHRQYISRYRRLAVTFDDEMAMRIADILETDPAYVVACMHAQRAKRIEEKKLWERIASMTAGAVAFLTMVAVLPFIELPDTVRMQAFDNTSFYTSQNIHYTNIAICCFILSIIVLRRYLKAHRHDTRRR